MIGKKANLVKNGSFEGGILLTDILCVQGFALSTELKMNHASS